MCRRPFVLQRTVAQEARTVESPVGLGTRALPIQGPRGQALGMHGSVWSLIPDPSFLGPLSVVFDGKGSPWCFHRALHAMLSLPSSPACPTIISRMGRTKVHPWPQFPVFPFPSSLSVQ